MQSHLFLFQLFAGVWAELGGTLVPPAKEIRPAFLLCMCVCVHLGEQSTNLIRCSLAISQHCTTAFFFCYGTLTTDIRKNVYGQCFSGSCVSYTHAV